MGAEGFSCSLDVLYGSLEISTVNSIKTGKKFSSYILFPTADSLEYTTADDPLTFGEGFLEAGPGKAIEPAEEQGRGKGGRQFRTRLFPLVFTLVRLSGLSTLGTGDKDVREYVETSSLDQQGFKYGFHI